jgi:hypothetical protein
MNISLKILVSLLILIILSACAKEKSNDEPVVNIYKPEFKEAFLLPNIISIGFSVEHTKPLEYLRISIDNSDLVAISEQYFLYPESNYYKGDIEVDVGIIPNEMLSTNYYVHIAVSDFNEVNHTYLEIDLANTNSDFKGCFIIGKHQIDRLNIDFYNSMFEKEYTFEINGNYSDSDISEKSNMLVVATSTPDNVRGFDCANGELKWKIDPQLPYPEFNKVVADNNLVYLSTEIGRIMGVTSDEGSQIYNTTILRDSIPLNICVTNDYIIADYRLRNSNSKLWASFYKNTGSKFNVTTTNIETIDLYGYAAENKMVAFCSNNSSGEIITFDISTNNIENRTIINNTEIVNSCKIDNNNYLFSSSRSLYHFDWQNKSVTYITELEDDIIDLKYDFVYKKVFIAHTDRLVIYTYPELIYSNTIEIPYFINAVELLYGY